MPSNPVISQIVVGGVTYDIRDKIGPDGALTFIGISTTAITDGGTQAPTIGGTVVPTTDLKKGDVVLYAESGTNYKEFLWMGSAWELLGDEGSYVMKGTYTTSGPSGTIEYEPNFYGEEATITMSGSIAAQDLPVSATSSTSVPAVSFSTSYTPGGTVGASGSGTSGHSFSGTAATLSTTIVPNGGVSASGTGASGHTFSGTAATIEMTTSDFVTSVGGASYTPGGSVSIGGNTTDSGHTFKGTSGTVNVTTSGTAVTAVGNHSYQPAGTVSKPNITVTPNRVAISPVTGGTGTAIASVAGEVLTIKDLPTTTFATNVTAALAATPTFTGTTATLEHSLTKGSVSSTGTFTPAGDVMGSHSFSGTAATITPTYTKAETTLSTSYTPAGSVKGAHSFTGSNTNVSIDYTPAGSVLGAHSWTGTAATISFSKRLVAALSAATISASGTYTPEGNIFFQPSVGTQEVASITVPTAGHTHTVNLSA